MSQRTVPLKEACERLYADAEARNLGPAPIGKYRLLVKDLENWFPDRVVSGITADELRAYRESWKLSPVSAR